MTTHSDGYMAKRVLDDLKEQRPGLYNRIKRCQGTRMPMPFNRQRVLRVTLTDGQFLQVPFAPLGTHTGSLIGQLVDTLMKWKVRDDPGHPVCPSKAGVLVCDVASHRT